MSKRSIKKKILKMEWTSVTDAGKKRHKNVSRRLEKLNGLQVSDICFLDIKLCERFLSLSFFCFVISNKIFSWQYVVLLHRRVPNHIDGIKKCKKISILSSSIVLWYYRAEWDIDLIPNSSEWFGKYLPDIYENFL